MQIVFNNFTGGLNNVISPTKLGQNQATVLDNVDTRANTLKAFNKDQKVAEKAPYQLVYFNQLIGATSTIADMDTKVSQWGKYYTKDKIYYVNSSNTIESSPYNIGAPTVSEITTTVNQVNFDNAKDLKGVVYGVTEDADGILVSDLVIDGITKQAVNIYKAWEDKAIVVYALDIDGTELTGIITEVINSKMPYMIDSIKYAYENAIDGSGYTPALATNSFKLHYEPIMYSIYYTYEGVKQEVTWIDSVGNPIEISKAVLYNSMVVTSANETGVALGYARGNIVENMPFIHAGTKYTFSAIPATGYTTVVPALDAENPNIKWVSLVKYDATDYDATDYHTYAITLYNSKTGQETPPIYGTTTKVHPAELGSTVYAVLAPDPDGVYSDFTKARIYRVSGPYTTYMLAKEVNVATQGDSIIISLEDTITNAELTYQCETTEFVGKPQIQGITGHANRIFGYNGNTLYFTLTDNPYSWSEFGTIYVEGSILAIQSTNSGLFIITSAGMAYLVTGTNPSTFVSRKVAENVGYTSSMVGVQGNAYWVFDRNIYVSNGSSIQNLTEDKFNLPVTSIIDINVIKEDIYLIYANEIFRIHKGAIVRLDIPNVTDTVVRDGQLRYFQDGWEYILEGSIALKTWKYVSPGIVVSSLVDVKEYNEVEVAYTGEVTCKLYIDNTIVLETLLSSSAISVETLKLPADQNDGHILLVEFSGTGEVFEYKVEAEVIQ